MADHEVQDGIDVTKGFVAATCAPALIAGTLALPFGPVALFVVWIAFVIALLHVMLVAVPLYLLVSRLWRPGPGTVLVAAPLVGWAPIVLLSGKLPDLSSLFLALLGFVGGCAFLLFGHRLTNQDGYY